MTNDLLICGENIFAFLHIRKPFLIQFMTLHPIPSEFPYIWGNFFIFISVEKKLNSIVLLKRPLNYNYMALYVSRLMQCSIVLCSAVHLVLHLGLVQKYRLPWRRASESIKPVSLQVTSHAARYICRQFSMSDWTYRSHHCRRPDPNALPLLV
jgi:hypothetical protein